jgi:hypothetical protein
MFEVEHPIHALRHHRPFQGFQGGVRAPPRPEAKRALGISYKTAANNCSQIKAKLRAGSTADLIRIAIQHGLNDRDARRP